MANNFYARLMNNSDDTENYPNFNKNQFFALLREMARHVINKETVISTLILDPSDDLVNAYLGYIMTPSTEVGRLSRVQELQDIHFLNEQGGQPPIDFTSIYGTEDSLRRRIGL